MIRHREQQGVALIFALGILSLILVMGVAFLGNALIGQKIALNSRETASARLTARSALDRAMTQLVLFNLTQCGQFASSYLAPEASSVFSRIDGGGAVLGDDQGETKDQLAGADSKLNVGPADMLSYHGKDSRARWVYVHRNGIETNGTKTDQTANPIIARYAYQVLPPPARTDTAFSRNSLSLYAVTSGADGVAGVDSDTANRKAQTHRWGIDADELCISDLSMFSAHWTGSSPWSPQHEFDNFQNLLSGSGQPFYWSKTDAAAKKMVESRKRWLRYAFTEGRGRVAREAFSGGAGVWYTRFNLSDGTPFYSGNDDSKGNWYSRLLTTKPASAVAEANMINGGGGVTNPLKNSETAVNNLARFPDHFEDGFYCDKDGIEDNDDFFLGIPFLTRIGSQTEKGAFDLVENFRKQIAANLNDYCDSDSVPTSDKLASTWMSLVGKTDAADLPKYTGNEKTPYINEVGFGFMMENAKIESGSALRFTAEISSELLAELINVYGGAMPVSVSALKLYGALKYLSLTLDISIKGNVTAHYKKPDLTTVDVPFTIEEYRTGTKEVKLFDSSTSQTFTIDWSSGFVGSGPYWVKNTQFPKQNISCDLTDVLTQYINDKPVDALSGKSVDSYDFTLTGIRVAVTKVTFNLGNLVLSAPVGDPPSGGSDPTEAGIDFVRVHQPESGNGHEVSVAAEKQRLFGKGPSDTEPSATEVTSASALTSVTAADKCIFHLGGMEAVDPRQNLHAKVAQVKENDWRDAKEHSFAAASGTWEWSKLEKRISGGSLNSCSNPGAPNYADGSDIDEDHRDKETATDPAWLGDGANQHISTAVIRNKPMRSPWELGFIHRAAPFQTINLKMAGGLDGGTTLADDAHKPGNFANWTSETGTAYVNGDAGILDQIKMTEYNKSFGKIDVSTLIQTAPTWWVGTSDTETFKSHNEALYKALFRNIRVGQKAADFLTESDSLSTVSGTLTGTKLVDADMPSGLPPAANSSVSLRSKFFKGLESTFRTESGADDAAREELIGKTVNLLDANSCSPGNVYRIVIVAQIIRDMEGTGTQGKFDVSFPDTSDPEKNVYTDQILGECRMLATVEKITYLEGTDKVPRVRLRVRQIEYLD